MCSSDLIPNGVEIIGEDAFIERHNVRASQLPTSLLLIDKGAFAEAINLRTINLHETMLQRIHHEAFNFCISLQDVIFPSTINYIDIKAFEVCYALQQVDFTLVSDTIYIERNAFKNCITLSSLNIREKTCVFV